MHKTINMSDSWSLEFRCLCISTRCFGDCGLELLNLLTPPRDQTGKFEPKVGFGETDED